MIVHLRRMAEADLPAVLGIQQASPEASQWSAADWRAYFASSSDPLDEALKPGSFAWIACSNDTPAGFLAALFSGEELEILNLSVATDARRKGIASELLERVLDLARNSGAQRAWLEVRASNAGALAFYERNGFHDSGRRENYYSAPREDAILLSCDLRVSH